MQGICSVLTFPCSLGMSTRRLGWGLYLPVSRSSFISARKSFSPAVSILLPCHMDEDAPEAMCLFRLRLPIYPPSQLLQRDGCLCHLTPCLALTNGVPHRSGPFPPGAFCCTPINSTV